MADARRVTHFTCPATAHTCACRCPDGPCEHVWNGSGRDWETPDGGFVSTATCSRCGMTAIDHSLWTGP